MESNSTKHFWIFLSAYGAMFAVLSWLHEIYTQGFWLKGALAFLFGFVLYKIVIDHV